MISPCRNCALVVALKVMVKMGVLPEFGGSINIAGMLSGTKIAGQLRKCHPIFLKRVTKI